MALPVTPQEPGQGKTTNEVEQGTEFTFWPLSAFHRVRRLILIPYVQRYITGRKAQQTNTQVAWVMEAPQYLDEIKRRDHGHTA